VKPSYVYGLRIIHGSSPVVYNLLEDRKPLKGNTVGSRSEIEKAYIAGFLDGDGSIMLQIKRRSDTSRGYRFMATICLYQDSRHDLPFDWIRSVFNVGYISKRNDGMSELRINGFVRVQEILTDLLPFIRFKKLQAEAMIKACQILSKNMKMLSKQELIEVIELILIIQNENYVAHRKKSYEELLKITGLTP
jgi:hypothetical protein